MGPCHFPCRDRQEEHGITRAILMVVDAQACTGSSGAAAAFKSGRECLLMCPVFPDHCVRARDAGQIVMEQISDIGIKGKEGRHAAEPLSTALYGFSSRT